MCLCLLICFKYALKHINKNKYMVRQSDFSTQYSEFTLKAALGVGI